MLTYFQINLGVKSLELFPMCYEQKHFGVHELIIFYDFEICKRMMKLQLVSFL